MITSLDPQPRRVSLALPLSKPLATYVLLAIIVVVFGIETLLGGSTDTAVLIRMGAKATPLIAAGQYWRLFTAMFLHIGFMHLFFNGYALLAIGTELERFLGWQRFLVIYVLSGLFGNLLSYAFSPSVAAGASGAIFGLIGSLAAYFMIHREVLGSWGQRRLFNIAFLIVVNLILGFTQPGIDNLAHMGGLLSGFALGWALAPRYQVDPLALKLIDRNKAARYWPALAAAVVLLVGGTLLTTAVKRDSVQSHLWRAEQALEREAWAEMADELEQALAQDPAAADVSLYFYLGLARNYLAEPQAAAEAYEKALALQADHSPSLWNLALTYLDLGRYAEARTLFQTYLELNPDESGKVQPYLQEIEKRIP